MARAMVFITDWEELPTGYTDQGVVYVNDNTTTYVKRLLHNSAHYTLRTMGWEVIDTLEPQGWSNEYGVRCYAGMVKSLVS